MSPIVQGLYMTGIGMGLVFIAILALWALMDILVKVTNERPKKITSAVVPESVIDEMLETGGDSVAIPSESEMTNTHKVAAVAVAIAIGLNQRSGIKTRQDNGVMSPWLSTRRTNILSQSADLLNRKNRGTSR